MNGWATVALADLLTEARPKVAVQPDVAYPIAGVLGFGRGVLLREAVLGGQISASHLYQISAGQIIYSRLKAFEGAFAVVPPEADGRFVSNEFPTFDVNPKLAMPDFLGLLLGRRSVWEELAAHSLGMGARRERLQVPDFLDFEVDLPSLVEQQEITSAIRAIDVSLAEARTERDHLNGLLRAFQWDCDSRDCDRVELDEILTSIDAGKSPKCFDRPPSSGEWGVLKVSAIREGAFFAREAKALPDTITPFRKAQVHAGDVLVSRANTSELVGAACIVAEEPDSLLLCDKTLRFTLDTGRITSDYFIEAMALPSVREQIVQSATGTSDSMKNISQASLRALELPLPTVAAQQRLVDTTSAIRAALRGREQEFEALQRLRDAAVEHACTEGDARPLANRLSTE